MERGGRGNSIKRGQLRKRKFKTPEIAGKRREKFDSCSF